MSLARVTVVYGEIRFKNNLTKLILVTWVRNEIGAELAVVGGHTFFCSYRSKIGDHWICTAGCECRARIIILNERDIMNMNTDHSHPPPNFFIRDGVLFKK